MYNKLINECELFRFSIAQLTSRYGLLDTKKECT